MHPRVYMNISRHLSRAPFGELEEAHTAPYLLNAVAKDLFKSGINWAKIISIFTVSGKINYIFISLTIEENNKIHRLANYFEI